MSQVYSYKAQGLRAKDKQPRPRSEVLAQQGRSPDFKLVFRPWTELRAGLSGSSDRGVDPATGRIVPLGNPVMLPASRFQTDTVLVEDAVTGEQITVCWDQVQARKHVAALRNARQPKPAAIKVA